MVSEDDCAFSRGRIPAHEVRGVLDTSLTLLLAKAQAGQHRARLLSYGCDLSTQQSTIHFTSRCYSEMISNHFMSYNKFSRPYIFYDQPRIDDPTTQFTSAVYYQMTGFWPQQLEEICHEMVLLPDIIRCQSTGCRATKHFALFLLLRRWHTSGTWESVSYDLRQQRSWCIQMYHATFQLVAASYKKCVGVLDYRRINPLLSLWGQQMSQHCGCDDDVIFFTDGKPWRMSRPGKGRAVREICAASGAQDVNLMQRAFYNGHYKYHGAKVQHVLQADGMAYSFTCPIRSHDASVLRTSAMFLMLSNVYIDGDHNRPAKTVTDKAYGRTPHFQLLHTETELRLLGAADRIIAADFDKRHKKPRLAVENSFNQQTTKFRFTDSFRNHKITQSGTSNWNYLRSMWDLQTLFFNLFTCSAGSQVTGVLGVCPPTVQEYLYSCNNNLLIDLPDDGNEVNFDIVNDFYI